MSKTVYIIFWTRLNEWISKDWYTKYTNSKLPKFLTLEGSGAQYYCAFPKSEAQGVINNMVLDKHELRGTELDENIKIENITEWEGEIEGNPETYSINMEYVETVNNGCQRVISLGKN
jgi:hypothetical protein